jgi:hypothetical protein
MIFKITVKNTEYLTEYQSAILESKTVIFSEGAFAAIDSLEEIISLSKALNEKICIFSNGNEPTIEVVNDDNKNME